MKCLAPLWNLWTRTYLRWALREIDPQHPDVPEIVAKLAELES